MFVMYELQACLIDQCLIIWICLHLEILSNYFKTYFEGNFTNGFDLGFYCVFLKVTVLFNAWFIMG